MDKLADLLRAIQRIPTSLLFVVAVSIVAVLFLPADMASALGIDEFRAQYKKYLGPSLILVGAWLLARLTRLLATPILEGRSLRRRCEGLWHLTAEERGYLRPFIEAGQNTITVDMTDGVAGGLAAKGIIYRSSNVINLIDGVPYNLQPWARLFLSTHPEVLDDAAQMPPSRREQWRRRRLTRYESG